MRPFRSGLDEDVLRHSERESPMMRPPPCIGGCTGWIWQIPTPAMVRQALTPDTDSEVAEALLRYFVRRREPSDVNRDKTDLIATFLYRLSSRAWAVAAERLRARWCVASSPFEIALIEILADMDVPSLPRSM